MIIFAKSIKIIWLFFWLIAVTLLLFIPITLAALLSRTGNLAFQLSKIWAWTINKTLFVQASIRGREKIRPGQAYIIVSNHQSHMDIPSIITQIGLQFRWVIKKELLWVPLFGYALYASRNIFIDRSDRESTVNTLHKGVERLPPGVGILFFAEGTRSPDGQIQSFKKGAFVTALNTGWPILPLTVNGSRKVLPKGSYVFSPGRIEVVVGDPIDTSQYSEENMDLLIAKTRETILASFLPPN